MDSMSGKVARKPGAADRELNAADAQRKRQDYYAGRPSRVMPPRSRYRRCLGPVVVRGVLTYTHPTKVVRVKRFTPFDAGVMQCAR